MAHQRVAGRGHFPSAASSPRSISLSLLRVRSQVVLTLILVNGALALALSLIGYFAVKHMLQPLGVLARHVERVREGRVEPIPERYRKASCQ